MTIQELTDLLFHDADSAEIFLKGFAMQAVFEITGLAIAALRKMKAGGDS